MPLLNGSEPSPAERIWRYRGQVQTGAKFNHDSPQQSTANLSIACKSLFRVQYPANHSIFLGLSHCASKNTPGAKVCNKLCKAGAGNA
jgi:hypothetical protein